jgi:dihydropteroate synthase
VSVRRAKFAEVVRASVARRGVAIMGVCNVTPDSFSDGGRYLDRDQARARVDQLIAEGADIVDIGGESTRPGSQPVPATEQIARVLDIVRYAAERICVSIDTTSPEVAATCLDAGAHAVNDVSLLANPDLARVTAGSGAMLVLSHARAPQAKTGGFGGWPLSLSPTPAAWTPHAYGDIVRDVLADWERAAEIASKLGLPRGSLVMDPGLGFSKASRHSFELLRRAREIVAAMSGGTDHVRHGDVPVLFGASNKSFLTLVDRGAEPAHRIGASIAAAVHAVRCGVKIVRVHEVRATRQAIDMDVVLATAPGHAGPDRAPQESAENPGDKGGPH